MAIWTAGNVGAPRRTSEVPKPSEVYGRKGKVRRSARRVGASTVDYVLILAVMMPMVAWSIWASRQILGLAYEFLCVLVSWPFM